LFIVVLFRHEVRALLAGLADIIRGNVAGKVSLKGPGGMEIVAEPRPEEIQESEVGESTKARLREVIKNI